MRRLKFIEKQLTKGEKIKAICELHWIIRLKYIYSILSVLCGLIILFNLNDLKTLFRLTAPDILVMFSLDFITIGIVYVIYLNIIIKNTEVALTNKRIIFKNGWIRINGLTIGLDNIESCYFQQDILARIFGYGTITISGISNNSAKLSPISNYQEFMNKIDEEINNLKK